jgi:hypothetical protein
MIADHERFKDIAAGIQSYILSLAILVGGSWTLYTFWTLGTATKATQDVEVAKAQLAKLNQELAGQGFLDLSIQARPLSMKGHRGILAEVTIRNTGSAYTTLPISEHACAISGVKQYAKGILKVSQPVYADTYYEFAPAAMSLGWIGIDPGASRVLPFFAQVQRRGVYLVVFQTKEGDGSWGSSTYVAVP